MLLFTEGCASTTCQDNCRCEDTEHTFRCVCPEQHGVHGLITHTPSKSYLSQQAFIAVVLRQQRYENDVAHIGLVSLRIFQQNWHYGGGINILGAEMIREITGNNQLHQSVALTERRLTFHCHTETSRLQ